MRSDVKATVASAFEGCYEADRAAALSGVPISTVYDWARKGVVAPSLSAIRPKRWSYADLMALRIVSWLRHPKFTEGGRFEASPMTEVRRALNQVSSLDLDLWTDNESGLQSPLLVHRDGAIVIGKPGERVTSIGQGQFDVLDLLGPFDRSGLRGPDLRRPRAHLRIVPGKVSGEPHLQHSRLTTRSIASLAQRGYDADDIAVLYPDELPEGIREAIDLEAVLSANQKAAA